LEPRWIKPIPVRNLCVPRIASTALTSTVALPAAGP
jgi:hypothetical protein